MKAAKKRMIYVVIALIVLLPIAWLAIRSASAKRPDNLGVHEGQLSPCPSSPNCVCTTNNDTEHHMDAIAFTGTDTDAVSQIKSALATLPRTKIVTERDNYIHAESASLVFHFVDDVEFLIDDEAKVIHFRSASRIGHSDLGVNRARMEAIRKQIQGDS